MPWICCEANYILEIQIRRNRMKKLTLIHHEEKLGALDCKHLLNKEDLEEKVSYQALSEWVSVQRACLTKVDSASTRGTMVFITSLHIVVRSHSFFTTPIYATGISNLKITAYKIAFSFNIPSYRKPLKSQFAFIWKIKLHSTLPV